MTRAAACILILAAGLRAAPEVSVCARCHPAETAMFLKSPMGNSMGPPSAIPGGKITHKLSDSVITIEQRGSQMFHILTEHGTTAEYPIAYQIGSGKDGYTYLVQISNFLFESPASWYRPHGWDASPGYQGMPQLDFDRLMDSSCLFCHSDKPEFTDTDGRRYSGALLTAIRCDRCHGSGDEHVRHPSARNIINPAKLPQAARDSVCEQCHLEGAMRMLNPGKRWIDFRAGEPFEQTATIYVPSSSSGLAHAVSQAEQLARSKCAAASGGKLWCASCHNPHKQTSDPVEVRHVCESCHATLSKAAHPAPGANCVTCHMPRLSPDDIPHSATTDHRIPRRPLPPDKSNFVPDALVAWREPPEPFRARDLAIAESIAAERFQSKAFRESSERLLNALVVPADDKDIVLLGILSEQALQQRNTARAVALARRAVESAPDSGHAALILAIALRQSGDLAGAEQMFRRTTELDPGSKQAWIELARLYRAQNRNADLIANMDRYLKWNPQSIAIRQQKARMTAAPAP